MMLRQVLSTYRGTVIFYIVNGIVQITAANLSLVYFQRLIDQIPIAESFQKIVTLIMAYGCFKLVEHVLSYLDEYPMRKLSNGIYQSLKIMAVEKISRIDYQAYQGLGTGKLIQTIENGATAGRNILYGFYLQLFKELLPGVVITLIFIGNYNREVMITIAGGYVLVFVITNLLLKYLYRIKKAVLQHEEDLSKFSVRSFMELVVFRINQLFETELKKIRKTSHKIVKTRTKIRMVHEAFFLFFELIVIVLKIIIFFYGAKKVLEGQSTIGTIVALIFFVDKIYTPIAIFNVLLIDYKLDQVAFKRFNALMSLPDDNNLEIGESFQVTQGTVELENLEFNYDENQVIKKLSMQIEPGKSIALVGKSGSGKSTITKLILGLLKPSAGIVKIDGVDIAKSKLNDYFRYVTYLSQEAPIFDGTLRENIVLNQVVDEEKIHSVLEKVRLQELVSQLPKGLDTELGEKGIKLSGGEKQRLAFARVILQDSKIVILDEPTSALDSVTEEKVIENILQFLGNRTIIIISHRLKTIKNVNQIFVIEDGMVKESGDFQTLIKQKGVFYDLWKRQI